MATLIAIALKTAPRTPMKVIETARITTTAGVDGDARGEPGGRQVTVLCRDAWRDACDELNVELPWTFRRANLLVEGIPLFESTGKQLRIGDALFEITGETEPCGLMDAQHTGLLKALEPHWRGGVCCRVLAAGDISVGDTVIVEEPVA